jgi:hypothetical protein
MIVMPDVHFRDVQDVIWRTDGDPKARRRRMADYGPYDAILENRKSGKAEERCLKDRPKGPPHSNEKEVCQLMPQPKEGSRIGALPVRVASVRPAVR